MIEPVRKWFRRRWPQVFVRPRRLTRKDEFLILHALDRARERFRVHLGGGEYWELVRQIQDGEATRFRDRRRARPDCYLVRLPNRRWARAGYCSERGLIKTFMPNHHEPTEILHERTTLGELICEQDREGNDAHPAP